MRYILGVGRRDGREFFDNLDFTCLRESFVGWFYLRINSGSFYSGPQGRGRSDDLRL
jgi:hypothetical protein